MGPSILIYLMEHLRINTALVPDQRGNCNSESDGYNQAHYTPQSKFNNWKPMQSDFFHIYPTDGYVNNKRSNYPLGELNSATRMIEHGTKHKTNACTGTPSCNALEPLGSLKGDIAQTYF